MVTLYTWLPTPPAVVRAAGLPPDVGHSAARVLHPDGSETYVSFWPEVESLIGRVTHRAKPRTVRNPVSYAVESDRAQPYMQRPADYEDSTAALDERRLAAGWGSVADLPYDWRRWNCSDVLRLLILTAMEPIHLGVVLKAADFRLEELEGGRPAEVLRAAVLESAVSGLAVCHPTDVRRLVRALQAIAG